MHKKTSGTNNNAIEKDDLKKLHPLCSYLNPYRWQIAGALLAILVSAGTTLALGQGLKVLIDQGIATGQAGLLNQVLYLMFAIALIMACASFFRYFLISWIGEKVVADLRNNLFSHLVYLSPSFYEEEKVGNVVSRFTTDTTLVQTVVGSAIPIAVRNILIITGGIILLMITSAKLTGVVLAFVPLILLLVIFIGRRLRHLSRDSQDRVADVGGHLEESLNAIKTVQAFNHEQKDLHRFRNHVDAALTTAVRRIRTRATLSASVIFLAFSGITIMLWIGARDVFAGTMSAGELASFVFYAMVVSGAVAVLSDIMGDLHRAAGAVDRLSQLLTVHAKVPEPAEPASYPLNVKGAVHFQNLDFVYPSRPSIKVLRDFSLDIQPGEKIAFVGPSGAGKTTLFNLLLRYYQPQSGDILIDNTSILETSLKATRGLIGIVPQDPFIFSGSAYDNIAYGFEQAVEEEDVIAAAKAAYAHEFIKQLPQSYQTPLGEKGTRLSGGQKQRIAIARAILKNPRILLLDEATSALDSDNEAKIQTALDHLMQDRTTIMITHRLSSVQKADRIIVMDQGEIVQIGTHQQLIETPGLYKELVERQDDNILKAV